jgi:exodeoxyribonuclease-5
MMEHMLSDGHTVGLAAPTGKACSVLNSKQTLVTAQTLHSYMYGQPNDKIANIESAINAKERDINDLSEMKDVWPSRDTKISLIAQMAKLRDERNDLMEKLAQAHKDKGSLEFNTLKEDRKFYNFMFVDESSMLAQKIVEDLMDIADRDGTRFIFVGDGNQLPPINDVPGVDLRNSPIMLKEIVRQAADNGIIKFAHSILKSSTLPPGSFDNVTKHAGLNPTILFTPQLEDLPQYICFTNAQRQRVTKLIRDHYLKNNSYLPMVGERLMMDSSIIEKRVVKGDIMTVKAFPENFSINDYEVRMALEDRFGGIIDVTFCVADLLETYGHVVDKTSPSYRKARRSPSVMYPYIITCHKSQGSEWSRVALFNDCSRPEIFRPYLYTGATRARDELIILGAK